MVPPDPVHQVEITHFIVTGQTLSHLLTWHVQHVTTQSYPAIVIMSLPLKHFNNFPVTLYQLELFVLHWIKWLRFSGWLFTNQWPLVNILWIFSPHPPGRNNLNITRSMRRMHFLICIAVAIYKWKVKRNISPLQVCEYEQYRKEDEVSCSLLWYIPHPDMFSSMREHWCWHGHWGHQLTCQAPGQCTSCPPRWCQAASPGPHWGSEPGAPGTGS